MKESVKHFGYLDFINFASKTPPCSEAKKGDLDSKSGSESFTGTKNYSQAENYAINGWDAGIKQLESDDKLKVTGNMTIEDGVVGAYVNVGNYLAGLPNTMTQFIDETERNKDDLTIFINLGYSAGKTVASAMKYCQKVINEVNKSQVKHNVRLIGFFNSRQAKDTRDVVFIEIKKLDERFVLNSLAFAFHPSFFRRIMFKYLETQDYIDAYCYGRPSDKSSCLNSISNFTKKENINEYWVLPSLQHDGFDWKEEQIQKIKN